LFFLITTQNQGPKKTELKVLFLSGILSKKHRIKKQNNLKSKGSNNNKTKAREVKHFY
jgi:hypothetical protein